MSPSIPSSGTQAIPLFTYLCCRAMSKECVLPSRSVASRPLLLQESMCRYPASRGQEETRVSLPCSLLQRGDRAPFSVLQGTISILAIPPHRAGLEYPSELFPEGLDEYTLACELEPWDTLLCGLPTRVGQVSVVYLSNIVESIERGKGLLFEIGMLQYLASSDARVRVVVNHATEEVKRCL